MAILEDFFRKLLNKFKKSIELSIESNFTKGSIRVLEQAKREDLKPIKPTKKENELLTGQIYENIKGITNDMNKQIKNAIRNSILEKEDNKQTAARLDAIFKGKNATKINYKARLDMIAKTETTRIMNNGAFKTARRLGFTHKYIDIVRDNKTAGDSYLMYNKYGGKDKSIPIDEEFVINYNGREQRGLYPPLRPRDRELVFFTNK